MLPPLLPSFVVLALAVAEVRGEPPALELPKEVKGEPCDWIVVSAKTEGKVIRWVGVTPGLRVFPTQLLKDSHACIVVASKPGRYKLGAYTARGDEPSDFATTWIDVAGEVPPIPPAPPGPGPTPPPTPPVDPLTAKVQAALASDPGTDKAKHAAALAGFYSAMAKHVESDAAATVGDLLSDYRAAIPSVLPEGAIPATRKVCGQEVAAVVGDDAERKIDATLKAALVGLFTKLAKALEVK